MMKSFSFENIVLFLAGAAITVVVSFIFFRLQESRATNAHKERVDRANSEAMRSYVKLILQFQSELQIADLQSIDFSVSKEYAIKKAEMTNSREILETAIGLILQSDFIRHEEKEQIIKSTRISELREELRHSSGAQTVTTSPDVSLSVAAPISLAASSIFTLFIAYILYHAIDVKSVLETIVLGLAALFILFFSFLVLLFITDERWISKIMKRTKEVEKPINRRSKRKIIDADLQEMEEIKSP